MDKTEQKQCAAMAHDLANFRAPCCLCGAEPYASGLWLLDRDTADLLNTPVNKQRFIAYTLCKACCELPNREEVVEDHLIFLHSLHGGVVRDYGIEAPRWK